MARTIDEILNEMLTDLKNLEDTADTAPLGLNGIFYAPIATQIEGLEEAIERAQRNIFPRTARPEYVLKHGYTHGLSLGEGETYDELVDRIEEKEQNPPAGGNSHDYEVWANEVDYVKSAKVYSVWAGAGTVAVCIIADEVLTGSEVPSSYADITGQVTGLSANKLIDSGANFLDPENLIQIGDKVINTDDNSTAVVTEITSATELTLDSDIFTEVDQHYELNSLCIQVKEYIEGLDPVTSSTGLSVKTPTILTTNVTLTARGIGVNKANLKADITAAMNALEPDEVLRLDLIRYLNIKNGGTYVEFTAPVADVSPNQFEMIRPGIITVN